MKTGITVKKLNDESSLGGEPTQADRQKESWEKEFDKQFKSKEGRVYAAPKTLKRFISQAITADREKLVERLEDLKGISTSEDEFEFHDRAVDLAISIIQEEK